MNNQNEIRHIVARSLYFADSNLMFGWQGWAYKQATEWRRLHDSWANMNNEEKSSWLLKADLVMKKIKISDETVYEIMSNRFRNVNTDRWWVSS